MTDQLASIMGRITGFAIDHRKVAAGNVFGAFRGERFDGETVIADAVRAGAIAVVARPEAKVSGALHIAADEPRKALAALAADYFGPFPDGTVAITGWTAGGGVLVGGGGMVNVAVGGSGVNVGGGSV